MTDREKVIKGLECCSAMSGDECQKCPYGHECRDTDLPYGMPHLAADALALLKEQEPIEPITSDGDDLYWQPGDEDYACGACGEELAGSWWVYCPYCGRKVKWDD